MADRVTVIHHKAAEIIRIDWSNARPAEILEAMDAAKRVIASRAPASALTLTNVESAIMDKEVTNQLKDYVAHNKPYVLAGAVVGLNDLKMIAFNFVNRVTGRSLRAMDSEVDARECLANFRPA